MVILKAFIESNYFGWFDVWRGTSLRDLRESDFDALKSFYGVDNLKLVHSFDTSSVSNFVPIYEDECFDDYL